MENILKSPSYDLNHAKRILAVQPHYDDNDIAAGGTLYTLAKNGAEIIYLTVTDDLAGVRDQQLSSDQTNQVLLQNQNKAAESLVYRNKSGLIFRMQVPMIISCFVTKSSV